MCCVVTRGMDGCEDGILKTIVTVMVTDVYDSFFF